jgi:hypothetical protein
MQCTWISFDGKIDGAFFERMSAEWRVEQDRCLREIERHQVAEQSYLEEGVRLLELARNARRLFEKQEPREKRRLLNFVVSNCTWRGGRLSAILRQPFDFLEETATRAAQVATRRGSGSAKTEIWLPGPDSNQRPTG